MDSKLAGRQNKKDVKKFSFFYGIGTLQFIEALKNGYIDLNKDYVHNSSSDNKNNLFLTPIIPGSADAVTVSASINSIQAHGRELFGFDYDFSRTDYLIKSIYEYNSQRERPRKIRRSLYEFKKLCILNGIKKSQILPYLQLIKLTFKGFILEFNSDIISKLEIDSEQELYTNTEYRFRFPSNKIPFSSVSSYTGIGLLENRFTNEYYKLLDDYQKNLQLAEKEESKNTADIINEKKKAALNEFYLNQAGLIKDLFSNIHKPYIIKYISED